MKNRQTGLHMHPQFDLNSVEKIKIHSVWLAVIGFPIISYYFGGCHILTPPQNNFPISSGSWTMSEYGRDEFIILKVAEGSTAPKIISWVWSVTQDHSENSTCSNQKQKTIKNTFNIHTNHILVSMIKTKQYQTFSIIFQYFLYLSITLNFLQSSTWQTIRRGIIN